jgi:hypothetical protein
LPGDSRKARTIRTGRTWAGSQGPALGRAARWHENWTVCRAEVPMGNKVNRSSSRAKSQGRKTKATKDVAMSVSRPPLSDGQLGAVAGGYTGGVGLALLDAQRLVRSPVRRSEMNVKNGRAIAKHHDGSWTLVKANQSQHTPAEITRLDHNSVPIHKTTMHRPPPPRGRRRTV